MPGNSFLNLSPCLVILFGTHHAHRITHESDFISSVVQEWFRDLSFSRLECGVHDKLHIYSADWWDILLPLA